MADLLSAGAAMLSQHCPKCGTPLFRLKDGSIICPSCRREPQEAEAKEPTAVKEQVEKRTSAEKLSHVLDEKLTLLVDALERSNDPDEIKTILSCIRQILDLMKEK